MIWGPFLLALVLGLIVSAGLYFAYLWPSVEPEDPPPVSDTKPEPAASHSSDPEPATPPPPSESSPA